MTDRAWTGRWLLAPLALLPLLLSPPALAAGGTISASPQPLLVPDGTGRGAVTLRWTSTGTASVEVRVGAPAGPLFSRSGPGAWTATTGPWVTDGTVFYLQDTSAGHPLDAAGTLATMAVAVVDPTTGTLVVSPDPAPADASGRATVTLSWTSAGVSAVEVHRGSAGGPLVLRSGPGAGSQVLPGLTEDTSLYLQDAGAASPLSAGATLAVAAVHVVQPSLTATPDPARAPPGRSTAGTTLTWTTASEAVEVHLGAPAGPLVSRSGRGTSSTELGPWVADGTSFYLQDVSGGRALTADGTLAVRTLRVVSGTLTATPDPVRVRSGTGPGSVTLSWGSRATSRVEVRSGSPTGSLVARSGPGPASTQTGAWVRDGTAFYLQDVSDGAPSGPAATLATTVVSVLHPRGTLTATPDPLPIWDGSMRGPATLSWETSDVRTVELRSGAPDGPLVARTGAGPRTQVVWVTAPGPVTFFLQDVSDGLPLVAANTVATATVRVVVQPTVRPSIGVNKFDLFLQYLGRASGGDGSARYRKVTRAMAVKALDDAADTGLTTVRVAVTGTRPDVWGREGDLELWRTDPAAYWQLMDEMVADLRARGLRLIPVLVWNWAQFPAMAGGTTRDLVTDPASPAYRLLTAYVTELVTRYRGDPTVEFYELTNELDLKADLDQHARALADPTLPAGAADVIGNISTDEMIGFTSRLAALVRSVDPAALVSAGHSIPRRSAEHLRRRPEYAPGGPDWTRDSLEDFQRNLADIHRDMDVASVHFYNNGDQARFGITGALSTDLLDVIKATTDRLGKRLFLGEVADADPPLRDDRNGLFLQAVLAKARALRIPYTAPWSWEFYQRSTFTTYDNRLTSSNLEPGYTDLLLGVLRSTNSALGNPVPTPVLPDVRPPRVVVTWPLSGALLSGPRLVTAVASDDGGQVARVDFRVDGQVRAQLTQPPYAFTLDPATLPDGPHRITAVARDPANNLAAWSVDVTSGPGSP